MNNIPGLDPEIYEEQYEWLSGGYLADLDEDSPDAWEEDEDEWEDWDGDFPLSLEYDEGENDMYPDGDFYSNDMGDW